MKSWLNRKSRNGVVCSCSCLCISFLKKYKYTEKYIAHHIKVYMKIYARPFYHITFFWKNMLKRKLDD